jgi:gliding motility-associated-like protein
LSQSNYADVYIDANLFVPNAFVPKGHNKVFLPVLNYVDKVDYKLSIFDRWGTKVFETADQEQGWDGGSYEEGIYGYLIQYRTSIGEYRETKGTVMLVR